MKRHLKNVSLLVSLLTLLSAVSFVGGGAVATAEISVETEAGLLGALGIIDDKQFFVSNDNITRGELAELFAKATNHAGSDAESSVFADVPATHAKARYIYAAAALRLVNGYSDGRFMPDNKATWEETVKIAVTVLGYGSNAQFKGGYPMGYLTLANELGILRGIPYQSSLLVSRRDIVRFLYNVLKADMAVVKGIVVSDGESLDVQSKSTMLAEYFDVYERVGKVTANHNSAIYGKSNLKKGFVEIENTTYDAGDSGTSALLGYMARFFYQDNDSDTPVILYAYKDPSRNDEFTVLAEDLVNASASSVTYSVNGRTKTASVPVDADLIFNGKAQTSFDGTMLRPQAGSVTFVTVGNGSTNNLIIVNSWENCVVNAVNTIDKVILDKYLPERNIHLDKTAAGEDVDYTVTDKGGEPFALSSIREWHVLSFKRSIDGSLVEIVVSAQSVIGTADEIGENTVSIGGTEYEYAESYKRLPSAPNSGVRPVEAGQNAKFYLDREEKIAAVDFAPQGASVNYGFLLDCAASGSLSSAIDFKIVTAEDKHMIYRAANSLRVNDAKVTADQLTSNTYLYESGIVRRQLIVYELNEEGQVRRITTDLDLDRGHKPTDGGVVMNRLNQSVLATHYIYDTPDFGNGVQVNAGTKIFIVPYDKDAEDDYMAIGFKDIPNDRDYDVDFYDVTDWQMAGAMVFYDTNPPKFTESATSYLAMFDHSAIAVNAAGEEVVKVYYWQDRMMNAYETDPDKFDRSSLNALSKGQIMVYKYNKSKVITSVKDKNGITFKYGGSAWDRIVEGKVLKNDGSRIKFLKPNSEDMHVLKIDGYKVQYYDSQADAISGCGLRDIPVGAHVYIQVATKNIFVMN